MATALEELNALEDLLDEAGTECTACGDQIHFTDEVYLITMVSLTISPEGSVVYEPLLAEDDDYLYAPLFAEFVCWENAVDDLRRAIEDSPPYSDPYAMKSLVDCSICGGSILLHESLGLATKGEIHCSQRCPDGTAASTFDDQDPDPTVVCLCCMSALNEEHIDLWEEIGQSPSGECKGGLLTRCWRWGCPGKENCHQEEPSAIATEEG